MIFVARSILAAVLSRGIKMILPHRWKIKSPERGPGWFGRKNVLRAGLFVAQKIADFREQLFLRRRRGWRDGLGLFFAFQGVDALDAQKYAEGEDDEIEQDGDEIARSEENTSELQSLRHL